MKTREEVFEKVEDVNFERDELIDSHETWSGRLTFTYNGKVYDVDAEISEGWERRDFGSNKTLTLYGRPKEIKDDEEWEEIVDELRLRI